MSDVWSMFPDAPTPAARPAGADPWAQFPDAPSSPGRGDRLPLAPGAQLHPMPANTIQGGPTPQPESSGMEMADSAASRYLAGLLDVPGIPGDVVSLVDAGAGAAARGIARLTGANDQEIQKMRDYEAANPSLPWLPRSEDIKKFVGFEPFQPQTEGGKTFDKWAGNAIELAPSVLAGGGEGSIGRIAAAGGAKAAAKEAATGVAKYAVAPAVASEAAGEATQGTALEPIARLGGAVLAGGVAGAKKAEISGALSTDEWRSVASKAYGDAKAAGVGVKPTSFDRMVSNAENDLHDEGYRAALHPQIKAVLDDMRASKGVPQSFEELDQMHRLAARQTTNIDADTRRIAGILAGKIDDYMENLKPRDLIAGDPSMAFTALTKGRDAWRRMRTGERIDTMIQKAKDVAGKNYTAAGYQTALKQVFGRFKWQGDKLRPEFKRLSNEEKMLVNGIIGGANALRLIGKFNFRNPVVAALMGALGVVHPAFAGGALAIGEAARHASAKMTEAKVNQLNEVIRGGKRTPGRLGSPQGAVLGGLSAERATQQPQ